MQTAKVTAQLSSDGGTVIAGPSMPSWMKWTAISALVIIAAACVFNVVVYFFPKETTVQSQPTFHETVQSTPVSTPVVTDTADSSVDNTANADSVK